MKILVIDDDMATLTTVKANIELFNYECKTTTNDKQAIEMIDDYDVLITDYQLGNINGRQIVKTFKAKKPNLEIIMISGYSIDNILKRDDEFNKLLFSFHTKPISYPNLARDLERIEEKLGL
ncbi:MAG: hypothetical protein CR982_03975 [Candidatus Cloacimonadota bacterium]|nr:MAG: hypothetical protein CR982_03975 [Candidatus Cloacimonadota bacterium]PIE77690.1 MAG: hypothetical protein CSA15_11755 [Candidatus Delongbacteria bacterium]